MIHSSMQLSPVLVYAAQSLALFAALVLGIFFVLMIKRTLAKRSLEGAAKKKAKSDNYLVRIRPAILLFLI